MAIDRHQTVKELFERRSRGVNAFFFNRGFSPEECRDLTQQTFLELFKSLSRLKSDDGLESWLFSIATNIWKNRLRHASAAKRSAAEISLSTLTDESLSKAIGPAQSDGALVRLIVEEKVSRLRVALAELPDQMRRCVELRIQEFKYREIALALQVELGTVKSHINQAKKHLREKLSRDFTDIDF